MVECEEQRVFGEGERLRGVWDVLSVASGVRKVGGMRVGASGRERG